VESTTLKILTTYLDDHPKVGIVSPQLITPDGAIQQNGGSLPRLSNIAFWFLSLDRLPLLGNHLASYQQKNPRFYSKTRRTGWVSGTAMLLRRPVLDQIGLLDENLFMYAEDVDLCLRATQASWQIHTLHTTRVVHLGHASGSKSLALVGEVKGMLYLFAKHKPFWELPLLRLIIKSGALLRLTIFGTIFPDKERYVVYRQIFALA
jgi:GT2 family glycosyltransferase